MFIDQQYYKSMMKDMSSKRPYSNKNKEKSSIDHDIKSDEDQEVIKDTEYTIKQ